jgi:hypothetical protein
VPVMAFSAIGTSRAGSWQTEAVGASVLDLEPELVDRVIGSCRAAMGLTTAALDEIVEATIRIDGTLERLLK